MPWMDDHGGLPDVDGFTQGCKHNMIKQYVINRVTVLGLMLMVGTLTLAMWSIAAEEPKYFVLDSITTDSGLQVELRQRQKDFRLMLNGNSKDMARYRACNDYTISVTNRGNIVRKTVTVTFFLPGNVDVISYDSQTISKPELSSQLVWTLGDITPGQQRTSNVVVQFSYDLQSVLLLFRIRCQEPAEFCYISTPCFLWCEGCRPLLTGKFTKQGIAVGEQTKYVIQVENTTFGKQSFQISSTIPPGLRFITASGSFKVEKDQIVFAPVAEFISGAKVEYEITYQSFQLGTVRNLTTRLGGERQMEGLLVTQSATATAEVEIIGCGSRPGLTYDTEDPVEVGKQTTFVFSPRNEGTAPCTQVRVTCVVADEFEFVQAEPQAYEVQGQRVVFAPIPILLPGDKLVCKVVCKAIKTGSAKTAFILKYAEFSKEIIDEEGTSVYK